MRKVLRILAALAICLCLVGVVGVVAAVITNDTGKGIVAALISLAVIPVLFFVGVLLVDAYLAARATARGAVRAGHAAVRAGTGAARFADRVLYAIGIDTRKIAERWNERK
jgi:hypothetical protein